MTERDDEYLLQFLRVLECDILCEQLLESIRWSRGFCCPRCGSTSGVRMFEYRRIQCRKCRYQVSPTAGTIFHRTHVPLRKWFLAIFLMATDKRGTSALRLHKLTGVSYKTALLMLRKLRKVMSDRVQRELSGALLFSEEKILGVRQSKPLKALFYTDSTEETTNRIRVVAITGGLELQRARNGFETAKMDVSPVVAGSVSLLKVFLLGTYHRTSRLYAQLYFDEFSYRFNRNEPVESLQLLLADCVSQIAQSPWRLVKETSPPYGLKRAVSAERIGCLLSTQQLNVDSPLGIWGIIHAA